VSIELEQQLRAIVETLGAGHAGLSHAYIDALNRAAAQFGEQEGKSDLAAELREHAQAFGKPGAAFSIDPLVKTLNAAAPPPPADQPSRQIGAVPASLALNIESARLNSSLEISGWIFDAARQIKHVAAIVSLGTQAQRIVASFPLSRPDVAAARHREDAALSGFSADGLAALQSADVALEISYSDARAERVALGRVADLLRRFPQPRSVDVAPASYPPLLFTDILDRFDPRVAVSRTLSRPVDIIVPVYRGREFIGGFLDSLLESELEGAAVTIVDDGNDDPVVAEVLRRDRLRRPDVKLIRKQHNEGFVAAVCTGFDNRSHESDVILLNTDTVLPPRWLPRLAGPLQAGLRIASTTPFTNSGGPCSFPVTFEDNLPFLDMTTAELDAVFSRFNTEGLILDLPTGVGFCMGMSAEAISSVGFLDRVSFGRGYGEENDWCLRADAAHFRNAIVPDLYIHHKRGGSFTAAEKRKLLERNGAVIAARYPHYRGRVVEYQRADPLSAFRVIASALLACERYKFRPRIRQQPLPSAAATGPVDWIFNPDPVSICYDGDAGGRDSRIGIRVGPRVMIYSLDRPLRLEQLHRVFNAQQPSDGG
jgi:GT2 family glycosyltransferase